MKIMIAFFATISIATPSEWDWEKSFRNLTEMRKTREFRHQLSDWGEPEKSELVETIEAHLTSFIEDFKSKTGKMPTVSNMVDFLKKKDGVFMQADGRKGHMSISAGVRRAKSPLEMHWRGLLSVAKNTGPCTGCLNTAAFGLAGLMLSTISGGIAETLSTIGVGFGVGTLLDRRSSDYQHIEYDFELRCTNCPNNEYEQGDTFDLYIYEI